MKKYLLITLVGMNIYALDDAPESIASKKFPHGVYAQPAHTAYINKTNVKLLGPIFDNAKFENAKIIDQSTNVHRGPGDISTAFKSGIVDGIHGGIQGIIQKPIYNTAESFINDLLGLDNGIEDIHYETNRLEFIAKLQKDLITYVKNCGDFYKDEEIKYKDMYTRILSSKFYENLSLRQAGLMWLKLKSMNDNQILSHEIIEHIKHNIKLKKNETKSGEITQNNNTSTSLLDEITQSNKNNIITTEDLTKATQIKEVISSANNGNSVDVEYLNRLSNEAIKNMQIMKTDLEKIIFEPELFACKYVQPKTKTKMVIGVAGTATVGLISMTTGYVVRQYLKALAESLTKL